MPAASAGSEYRRRCAAGRYPFSTSTQSRTKRWTAALASVEVPATTGRVLGRAEAAATRVPVALLQASPACVPALPDAGAHGWIVADGTRFSARSDSASTGGSGRPAAAAASRREDGSAPATMSVAAARGPAMAPTSLPLNVAASPDERASPCVAGRGRRRLRPCRLGSRRLGSRRLGSRRLGSRRLGSRRLGSRRLGSRRLGSRRLGARAGRGPVECQLVGGWPERMLALVVVGRIARRHPPQPDRGPRPAAGNLDRASHRAPPILRLPTFAFDGDSRRWSK